jgi:segregation and condensation protein B
MPDNSEYRKMAEAALFVSSKAMSVSEIAEAAGIASVGTIQGVIDQLVKEYESKDSALGIFKVGDKYILSLKEPYASRVNSLAGEPEISKSSLRILAFISKNEPVMQSAVVRAFGSSTYDHMKELLEKEFVVTKKMGRSKRIETTQKFKEYFGVAEQASQ